MAEDANSAAGRESELAQANHAIRLARHRVDYTAILLAALANVLIVVLGGVVLWYVLSRQVSVTAEDLEVIRSALDTAKVTRGLVQVHNTHLQHLTALQERNVSYIEQLVKAVSELRASIDAWNVQLIRERTRDQRQGR